MISIQMNFLRKDIDQHVYKSGGYTDEYRRNSRLLALYHEGMLTGMTEWDWNDPRLLGLLCKADYNLFDELKDRTWEEDYKNYKKIKDDKDAS